MERNRDRVSRDRFSSFDWYSRGGGVWLNALHHATTEPEYTDHRGKITCLEPLWFSLSAIGYLDE